MKKIYSLFILTLSGLTFAQSFTGTYDFADVTLTSGATSTSKPNVTGISFSDFTAWRTGALATTNSSAAGRFSFVNNPLGATSADDVYANLTGAVDAQAFFEVTVGPNPGGQIDLSTITFVGRRSGTGVRTFVVRSSADGYAANLPASVGSSTLANVQAGNVFFVILDATTTNISGMVVDLTSVPALQNITSPVTFRFYGYNSEASGGTFSIDDVKFDGNIDILNSQSFSQIEGLKVYPNPVKDGNLYFSTKANQELQVSLFDVVGKQILSETVINGNLNVTNIPAGIYLATVLENNKKSTVKVVIE